MLLLNEEEAKKKLKSLFNVCVCYNMGHNSARSEIEICILYYNIQTYTTTIYYNKSAWSFNLWYHSGGLLDVLFFYTLLAKKNVVANGDYVNRKK